MPKKRKSNPSGSIILMVAGVLLIVGAIGWYLAVIADQPAAQKSSSATSAPAGEDNFPQIVRVSHEDAKAAYDQGQAVFVDVRLSEEYTQGHIPGAVHIPLLDLPSRISELSPDDWIITY